MRRSGHEGRGQRKESSFVGWAPPTAGFTWNKGFRSVGYDSFPPAFSLCPLAFVLFPLYLSVLQSAPGRPAGRDGTHIRESP
jgi:hypothetical protein